MSRINTAKEPLSSVLRGRENELSVKGETKIHARAFFNMAYWRAEDYRETMVALIKEGFEIVEWTVHGALEGVQVELLILDKNAVARAPFASAHFEYEDHIYQTEEEAHKVLTNVSEVRICRPGDHAWKPSARGMWSPDICEKCGLVKIPHEPKGRENA